MEYKICTSCYNVKLLTDFDKNKGNNTYKKACKKCHFLSQSFNHIRVNKLIKKLYCTEKVCDYCKLPVHRDKYKVTIYEPDGLSKICNPCTKEIKIKISNWKIRQKCTDGYIAGQIKIITGLSIESIKNNPELIELYRMQIKFKRLLKQKKDENTKTS